MPLLAARFRTATRLFAVFAVVPATLAGALVWVSWRLIQQDREVSAGRRPRLGPMKARGRRSGP